MSAELERRLSAAKERGVEIVDPRQTYIAPEVDLTRLHRGAVLYPGTRLLGSRTSVGPGAEIGTEGPATLDDAVFDRDTSIASGYAKGAVLLEGASAGSGAHLRPGTLLEEQASTAHCVGLKQTILLCFATLGSLINFCDALVAGGTSRRDHSEIGSGYIHFNYTPWGERGDKATPSLVGDVVSGVFLRKPRIFLGGAGGLVGPAKVAYGSIAAAGQVLRKDLPEGKLRLEAPRTIDRDISPGQVDRTQPRQRKNLAYLGQLAALRAWYREVRIPRAVARSEGPWHTSAIQAGAELLDGAIVERVKRLEAFVRERGEALPVLDLDRTRDGPCPFSLEPAASDHVAFVRSLDENAVQRGEAWLGAIASRL